MLTIYLAVVVAALYAVIRILGPEMAKPSLPRKSSSPEFIELERVDEPTKRIEKLEMLLAEKNKNIELLQMELRVLQVQVRNNETIKELLDEEIQRLRDINRVFRSELGLPTEQLKEKISV